MQARRAAATATLGLGIAIAVLVFLLTVGPLAGMPGQSPVAPPQGVSAPGNGTLFPIAPKGATFDIAPPGSCSYSVMSTDNQGGILFGNFSASHGITAYVLGGTEVPFNGGSCPGNSENGSSSPTVLSPTSYLYSSGSTTGLLALHVALFTGTQGSSSTWELVFTPSVTSSTTTISLTTALVFEST